MLRTLYKILGLTALAAVMISPSVRAQNDVVEADYYDGIKMDRYLDVEIWTNHSDNEFYEGDNIVLSFRTNRDAFVAIYSIDSKGRVNMLFPASPGDDNYVTGGVTYRFPDGADDFDLVVSGPDGVENIQAIASRERFPIPDWYPVSGLICDWDDRLEYMDYLNSDYFVRYQGQRFAFDRTAIYINHWEPNYYRPIYYPVYPSWSVCGNVYIDYPYGGTVYINGVYWGIAPLYIPRIYVGWHTFTVYDTYGYCWEYPVHVTRYNTIVLDRNIIVTSPTVVSKYKEVRTVGYRDPVLHGYPKYKATKVVTTTKPSVGTKISVAKTKDVTLSKNHVRGNSRIIKSDRGFESAGGAFKSQSKSKAGTTKSYQSTRTERGSSGKTSRGSSSSRLKSSGSSGKSGSSSSSGRVKSSGKSSKSSDYYQKKSSSSSYKGSSKKSSSKSSTKGSSKSYKSSKSSSSKSTSPNRSVEKKSSSSKSSSGRSNKKSPTPKKSTTTKSKTDDKGGK